MCPSLDFCDLLRISQDYALLFFSGRIHHSETLSADDRLFLTWHIMTELALDNGITVQELEQSTTNKDGRHVMKVRITHFANLYTNITLIWS